MTRNKLASHNLHLGRIDELETAVFFQFSVVATRTGDTFLVLSVTSAFSSRRDLIENRVLLAVHEDAFDFQVVAAGLTLNPEFIATGAPEGCHTTFKGCFQCELVGVADNQNLPCARVLSDGGY